jgi:ABC-type dipeptide/oligopeptide/nickel transport system ATPase component
MKVGNKLICIRNKETNNIKGSIYKILEIEADAISVSDEPNSDHFNWFCPYYKDCCWVFSYYFITIKEQRKQKLKKINESRRYNSL